MTPAGVTGDQIINNYPRYILVAPGTRAIEARKIIAQTTPAQASQVNPYANAFDVIEEPRLFNTAGAQRWWLAADPATIDTIEYCRLEGQSEPFLDQRVGFVVDGVGFKIRHDFANRSLRDRTSTKTFGGQSPPLGDRLPRPVLQRRRLTAARP